MDDVSKLLRSLPSIDELLKQRGVAELGQRLPHAYLTAAARRLLDAWRQRLRSGELDAEALERLLACADRELAALVERELRPLPRRLVNATGVVVHTNLGRARWAPEVAERALEAATAPCSLEYDVERGRRGRREAALAKATLLFPRAEAALAVNNCAAAVMLALNTLCEGREVVISRGELVEIGGSFRVPDVLAKSGCTLREVGTTNRTRLGDYEQAIGEQTAALLRVHPSNYRIVGFTETPEVKELVALARRHGLYLIEDLGSGLVADLGREQPFGEPSVQQALGNGVDVLVFSGDKLLGGPQAGLVLGRAEPLERMRRNPLYRALRLDKVTLAALDACLGLYLEGGQQRLPVIAAIGADPAELQQRARALALRVDQLGGFQTRVVESNGAVGGGAAPVEPLPGWAVAVRHPALGAARLEQQLRLAPVPVVARVEDEHVVFDLRTLQPDEEGCVLDALAAALATLKPPQA